MDDQPDDVPLGYSPSGYPSGQGMPLDARRLGLDRNTEEGALVAMATALSGDKLSHRVVAWALLASFGLPPVYSAFALIF